MPQSGAGTMPAMARLPREATETQPPMLPGGLTAPEWYPLAIRAYIQPPRSQNWTIGALTLALQHSCAAARIRRYGLAVLLGEIVPHSRIVA